MTGSFVKAMMMLTAIGLLTLAFGTTPATHGAEDGAVPAAPREMTDGQEATLTGRIVNLQRFMIEGDYNALDRNGHSSEVSDLELNPQTPIGLWVEERMPLTGIVLNRPVYLIVFDANDYQQQQLYDALRDNVDRELTITGTVATRHGMRAVHVQDIHWQMAVAQ